MDKRVEKIIQMMREDVSGELCLAEFAQSVNLSVWRLCHIFKTDVGMPPMRYLRVLRMERAKDLLESSFLSVKEIAFRVGLNDESHFVRDFKSTYGSSPACYRVQFRQNGGADPLHENSHNDDSLNGDPHHGNGAGKTNQPGEFRQQLAQVAKQSILPSLHVVVCMMSLAFQ